MDLNSLSLTANKSLVDENTGDIDVEYVYRASILFSAHFRYMAEDWSIGRSCLNDNLNMKMKEAFERYVL